MKPKIERRNKMKKNKGFTLIELLAVIVILAIIALIAVPVVMNIIGKANKSAFKDSAYGLLKAGELFYTDSLLENAGYAQETTFTFPNNIEGLEFKGSKPSKGSMTVNKDGKVSMAISNGKYCVTKGFEDDDVTIKEDDGNCKLAGVNTLSDLATTGTFEFSYGTSPIEVNEVDECAKSGKICEPGTPFAIKVNENEMYKFYVLSDTGKEVTLIMDRNLYSEEDLENETPNVPWVSLEDYIAAGGTEAEYGKNGNNNKGPITALNYLNSQTAEWNNIPEIKEYTYNNNLNGNTYGYQKLEIIGGVGKLTSKDGATITEITGESKARLLTEEEYNTIKANSSNVAPNWIYENLSVLNTIKKPYGYWLLTADPSDSRRARYIRYDANMYTYGVCIYGSNGVRPVITLSK